MTHFQAIQELCHDDCSENNSIVSSANNENGIPVHEARKIQRQTSVISNATMSPEKSPTINEALSQCDVDAIIKKEHKDLQEALVTYKQLKNFEFIKKFKQRYNDTIRTTEALIHLARNVKYEYHLPRSTIYNKGDLSNQKVYLIYSGAVDLWVGKPKIFEAEKKLDTQTELLETTVNHGKKDVRSLDDLSLLTDKDSFDRQNGKAKHRKTKINTNFRQAASSNSHKILNFHTVNSAAKQSNRLNACNPNTEDTYNEYYQDVSRTDAAPSSLNNLTSNQDFTEDEANSKDEFSLDNTLNSQASPINIRCFTAPDTETNSQKKLLKVRLSTQNPRISTLDDLDSTGVRGSVNDRAALTPTILSDEKQKIIAMRGIQTDRARIDTDPQEAEQNFILRKINYKKLNTDDLDRIKMQQDSSYGYVKQTFKKGSHFGQAALKSNQPRAETMVTATNCELLVLSVEDYEYLLTRFEKSNTLLLNFLLDYIPGLEDAINMSRIVNPESYFHEEFYQLHQPITVEGKQGDSIYLLYEGVCQIVKTVANPAKDKKLKKTYSTASDDIVICVIKPGVFIGEEVLFNEGSSYEYTVKAASSQVKLLAIKTQTFIECMPKVAYGSLETLFLNKKQKNHEIMNAKVEFARNKPKLPHILSRMVKTEDSDFERPVEPQVYNKRRPQAFKEEKRYSKIKLPSTIKPYSVEMALPTEGCPQPVDGMRFIRNAAQPREEPTIYRQQESDSLEREIKMNAEEKLTDKEKKLRRYMRQIPGKKEETNPVRIKKAETKSMNGIDMVAAYREGESNSNNKNDIENLRFGGRKSERRSSKLPAVEDIRKPYEGVGTRRLTELYSFADPSREKFASFLPQAKQRNSIFTINKTPQNPASIDTGNIKVKVNLKRGRVTYATGALKSNLPSKPMSLNSIDGRPSLDSNALTGTIALLSTNLKPLKEKPVFGMRATPEVHSLNLDYENDLNVKKDCKTSGRPAHKRTGACVI